MVLRLQFYNGGNDKKISVRLIRSNKIPFDIEILSIISIRITPRQEKKVMCWGASIDGFCGSLV